MGSIVEEPMLTRLDRLDNIMKQLEEIRGVPHDNKHSARSSYESTHSRSTSDDHCASSSSIDFSPKSMEKHCRPIDDVMVETERKGTLLERLTHVEDRVLKMWVEVEEDLRNRRTRDDASNVEKKQHKKGFKQMVKKCMPRKGMRSKEQMVA